MFAFVRRLIWIEQAVRILRASPYGWSRREARSYARGIYQLHLEEGFSAAEAIECDRQYWEA